MLFFPLEFYITFFHLLSSVTRRSEDISLPRFQTLHHYHHLYGINSLLSNKRMTYKNEKKNTPYTWAVINSHQFISSSLPEKKNILWGGGRKEKWWNNLKLFFLSKASRRDKKSWKINWRVNESKWNVISTHDKRSVDDVNEMTFAFGCLMWWVNGGNWLRIHKRRFSVRTRGWMYKFMTSTLYVPVDLLFSFDFQHSPDKNVNGIQWENYKLCMMIIILYPISTMKLKCSQVCYSISPFTWCCAVLCCVCVCVCCRSRLCLHPKILLKDGTFPGPEANGDWRDGANKKSDKEVSLK